MTKSLRVFLEHLIDYAGLFPPAALSMQDAVRNYARYRDGEYAWALGRFIVPQERLHEVPQERRHEVPDEFPLSVLGVDEVKAGADLATLVPGTFVEITDTALLPQLKQHGLRAKFRTGGITAAAFPTPESVAEFLRACKREGVAFKATAGLHHPLRCVKALTYAPDAPTGTMHGFVNVFLAAALLEHAEDILRDGDLQSFAFDDDGASWRGHRVSTEELATMRRDFATSFGSCSFEEPIGDLKELGWLS